jgi:probable rRNA maturation factor
MAGDLVVHINHLELAAPLDQQEAERALLTTAASEAVESGEISVTFLDAPAMAALNETHLSRQGPTDVIAFSLGSPDEPLGDVYVCPEVAALSAEEYSVPLREELLRLVIHGVLHVLGHDHPDTPDRGDSEMFRRQEEILRGLLPQI